MSVTLPVFRPLPPTPAFKSPGRQRSVLVTACVQIELSLDKGQVEPARGRNPILAVATQSVELDAVNRRNLEAIDTFGWALSG